MGDVVLDVRDIEKAFGAVSVLRGVSLLVEKGQMHALLGENGAGKSTLMRILLGAEQHDKGTMSLCGRAYTPKSPLAAREAGVVMVPQERTLALDLTVLENVMLGLEPTRAGFIQRSEARTSAEKALGLVTGVGRRIPLDVKARSLPVADLQLVEIARALAQAGSTDAKVLILDEPTSSLGHDDAARLFTRLDALRATGLAIVLVTHFLDDVRARADRFTVLRDGKVSGIGDPKAILPEAIVEMMLGRALETRAAHAPSEATGDVVLSAKELGGQEKPKKATFELRRGEVLGIAGLVGSGRTELLRMLVGLDPVKTGSLDVHKARIGLLSEDRGGEGLMLDRSIADNVTLSPRSALWAWPSAVLTEGKKWISELAIKASGPAQRTGDLSGGNQQKVQIARLLREDYDVLLFDEPTRGIDVASKAQVLTLVRELAEKGKAIVLVSSQLDELVSTCDRIAVLRRGELAESKSAAEYSEAQLLLEAST
jgi:ribose transport system ATP-binding protein